MTCVNCNRKGHAASECRQPKREKHERLCFTCNKAGHEARNCPDKPAAGARPIKAIEDAGAPRRVAVMAVTDKPRTQQSQLGDFIRGTPTRATPTRNRFQPLSLSVWQEIAAEVKSTAVSTPQYVSPCQTGATDADAFSDIPSLGHVPSVFSGTRTLRPAHAPPAPKGQGEIDGSARPAQADFNNSRGGYEHPSARPPHKYRTNIDITCVCAIEIDSPSIEKHARFFLVKIGHGGLRKVSFLEKAKESRLGGGNGIESRSGGGNGIGKEVDGKCSSFV